MQTLDINSQNYSQQRELYNIIHGYWITENSNHNNNINDINNTTYKDINSMHNPISKYFFPVKLVC
ncbi:unnamed protein product [Trichobilharzia regenti]|nr:unnamed protein product [Trichobilharzia regenti]